MSHSSRSSTGARTVKVVVAALLLAAALLGPSGARAAAGLSETVAEFERYSGAKLVFDEAAMPTHVSWYDRMPALTERRKLDAARLALSEVQRLPQGYLSAIGLETVGIFRACISNRGDGFRPYDKGWKGYVYFGLYQAKALAAAYYNDGQLPLTLHHEIFHHVDSTRRGVVSYSKYFHGDDPRFRQAVAGTKPYPPLALSPADRVALQRASGGSVLRGAVGSYAAKSPGEDQAETARYVMSHLPDALLQAATQPKLPGSQRILHILASYQAAAVSGPGSRWFVGAALRNDPYLAELRSGIASGRTSSLRAALQRSRRFGRPTPALAKAQATASYMLVKGRIAPAGGGFVIYGGEDRRGVNHTLRSDLARHGEQLAALGALASTERGGVRAHATRRLLQGVRLLATYYTWMAARWEVTAGTRAAFSRSIRMAAASLSSRHHDRLRGRLQSATFGQLVDLISPAGEPSGALVTAPRANRYLVNVDKAIAEPGLRATIRGVQPATVRISSGGSGVNIDSAGKILTNAHVLDRLGRRTRVSFPDGRSYMARCTHIDHTLDVAVATIETTGLDLPSAQLAPSAPRSGARVVVVGQPGSRTPEGAATGYGPFHVSVGRIRGFLPDLLGSQSLGRVKHDAWTYWGHSGSPLLDHDGRVVAMHNSWDSRTGMRHAVPWEALTHALKRWKLL